MRFHGLAARTLRTAAVALLVLGLQSPVAVAAAGSTDDSTTFAVRGPIAASAVAIAEGPAAGRVELDDDGEDRIDEGDDEGEAGCRNYDDGEDRCIDDGQDHFDAGDDEFNCDNVNEGEDPCQDNPPDRVDAGDDEFDAGADDAGCANYDDGEDRCLDKSANQVDAGNAVNNELAPGAPRPTAASSRARARRSTPRRQSRRPRRPSVSPRLQR